MTWKSYVFFPCSALCCRLQIAFLCKLCERHLDRSTDGDSGNSTGVLERKMTDLVTKQLMAAHLSLDLKQAERPEVGRLFEEAPPQTGLSDEQAMAARRGRTVFAIQSNIRLFRTITSSLTQSMTLIRLVSLDAWPLLAISFLQTARPILYGLSGSSFFGTTGYALLFVLTTRHHKSILLPHEDIT